MITLVLEKMMLNLLQGCIILSSIITKKGVAVTMKRVHSLFVLFFMVIILPLKIIAKPLSTPVYLNSKQGWNLLMHSPDDNSKFGNLVRYFQTQVNLAYCGVASSAIILNVLQVKAPADPWHYPYSFFNQRNIFSLKLLKNGITPHKISSHGMTLSTLNEILTSYGLKTQVYFASQLSMKQVGSIISEAMQTPGEYVLVNYDRKAVNQKGGGHISPLAAYSEKNHLALIFDVASYKHPAAWCSLSNLYKAMKSKDHDSGKSRGFVVVQR